VGLNLLSAWPVTKERKKSVERKKKEFCGTESSFCMASDQRKKERKKERKKSVERKKKEFCGTESSFCMASDQRKKERSL
jgi:hypothetical protein